MKNPWTMTGLLAIAVLLGWYVSAHADELISFGDTEKPKPEFQRSGPEITAKLIPRAKSTSVIITFRVSAGGALDDVSGIEFETVQSPEVDGKNFKSAVFEIRITDVTPGETAELSIRSEFFTQSTAFYVHNPKQATPWMDARTGNRALAGHVRELVIPVRDGGRFDADGLADGRITVIGGPRDSFWGYALGTLFIRFFGIFIVLSILMIGMIISGFVFNALEQLKNRRVGARKTPAGPIEERQSASSPADDPTAVAPHVPEEVVAAISAALHLHHTSFQGTGQRFNAASPDSAWVMDGRQRLLNDRLSVFNRLNR